MSLPRSLVELARADAREQHDDVNHAHDTWAEYVGDVAYWESRDGMTSEYMCRVGDLRSNHRRIARAMSVAWFAEARELANHEASVQS